MNVSGIFFVAARRFDENCFARFLVFDVCPKTYAIAARLLKEYGLT